MIMGRILCAALAAAMICIPGLNAGAAADAPAVLNGARAVQYMSGTAYFGAGREALDEPVIMRGETPLISETDFESLFNVDVTVSGSSVSISGGSGMQIGSNTMTSPKGNFELAAAPEFSGETAYLPVSEYGERVYGGGFSNDGHGMFLAGKNTSDYNGLKDANLWLFFERKTADALKTQFMSATKNGSLHPRLIADAEDFSRLAAEIKTDPTKSDLYSYVLFTAQSILSEAPAEYIITNGRLLDSANAALSRLEHLGFAYNITHDEKYAERGIEELMAICGFPDWNPEHFLDTATLAAAAAIGYDWLYNAMDDSERSLVLRRVEQRALEPALAAYEGRADFDSFWTDTETNWGIVCNGGIALWALASGEYKTDTTMRALSYALRSIESPWYRIAPDGAWYEGTDYWSYMLKHLSRFMSGYESVMNETFGSDFMGLDKLGRFQAQITGPDGLPNNYHDADETVIYSDGQFYISDLYNDTALAKYCIAYIKENNIRPGVMDIIWCPAGLDGDKSALWDNTDSYFGETELVSMRSGWDRDAAWVSFHGGNSKNAHDHVDPGTFVFCLGGERWAIDLGTEPLSYLANSDNPAIQAGFDSYYFYRRKGEGHNVLVINPDGGLETNRNAFAKAEEPKQTADGGVYSTVDLSSAYAGKAKSYVRGYRLSDEKRTLTIRDELTLKGGSELHWYMHTRGDIEIVDNNTAIILQNGKRLLVRLTASADKGETSSLSAAEAKSLPSSPQFENTPNTGVTKLDFAVNVKAAENQAENENINASITAELSLIGESGSLDGIDTSAIDQWPQQKAKTQYTLSNIAELSEHGYTLSEIPAGSGAAENDIAYKASASGVSPEEADPGFKLPFFDGGVNGEGKVRTAEFSFRYDADVPKVKLESYVAAHPSKVEWLTVIEFVSFKNGKIYVNGVDTGLTARDGEWFHIVAEEHYKADETRVIINGNVFYPGFENYIFQNRWTQFSADMSECEGVSDIDVVIKDFICYDGSYVPSGNDSVSLRCYDRNVSVDKASRSVALKKPMTADMLKSVLVTAADLDIYTGVNGKTADGLLLSGDVIILKSKDGKIIEYYYINAPETRMCLFSDGAAADKLTDGTIRAEASADSGGALTLYLAVYEDGRLVRLESCEKDVTERTALAVETEIENAENKTVKLMLWNDKLMPVYGCAEYTSTGSAYTG